MTVQNTHVSPFISEIPYNKNLGDKNALLNAKPFELLSDDLYLDCDWMALTFASYPITDEQLIDLQARIDNLKKKLLSTQNKTHKFILELKKLSNDENLSFDIKPKIKNNTHKLIEIYGRVNFSFPKFDSKSKPLVIKSHDFEETKFLYNIPKDVLESPEVKIWLAEQKTCNQALTDLHKEKCLRMNSDQTLENIAEAAKRLEELQLRVLGTIKSCDPQIIFEELNKKIQEKQYACGIKIFEIVLNTNRDNIENKILDSVSEKIYKKKLMHLSEISNIVNHWQQRIKATKNRISQMENAVTSGEFSKTLDEGKEMQGTFDTHQITHSECEKQISKSPERLNEPMPNKKDNDWRSKYIIKAMKKTHGEKWTPQKQTFYNF